ncbi:hypothetical protein RUM43_003162 [Polyplax serrata]|uniref:LIM zinc-binding domain-containing protein n=1 Tax=Polyplax serrata TaxID=468196 RepID=A0AAN8S313_POLSC
MKENICEICKKWCTGDVLTVQRSYFHPTCFKCQKCENILSQSDFVCRDGGYFCKNDSHPQQSFECAGCCQDVRDGRSLTALQRQWHVSCFKCRECKTVLRGDYMGRSGVPYCEKDFQKKFGVKCSHCSRFINDKVLQVGDNNYFHPTCARCNKCGDVFGDGEEIYLHGKAIWHPRCGPRPSEKNATADGFPVLERDYYISDECDFDRMSSSSLSEIRFPARSSRSSSSSPYNSLTRKSPLERTVSPGLILREYKSNQHSMDKINKIPTYSYLKDHSDLGYLRRPIDPYDKLSTSPHFHRPLSSQSNRSRIDRNRTESTLGMKVMVGSIRTKPPTSSGGDPIELARLPNAKKAEENSKIQEDDSVPPKYSYSASRQSKERSGDETEDEPDVTDQVCEKLKKEEEELSKIAVGIGKVFLQNVKEKLRQNKLSLLNPREASRVPSASKNLVKSSTF